VWVQRLAGSDTIVEDAKKRGGDIGAALDIGRVIAAAADRDERARKALQRAARYVGRPLAIVSDLVNPELVVLSGALGRDDYAQVTDPNFGSKGAPASPRGSYGPGRHCLRMPEACSRRMNGAYEHMFSLDSDGYTLKPDASLHPAPPRGSVI
jgi:predicted NBD/HSP70 family sugar kinase